MNRDNLMRKLNSVGKSAFVEHFDLFEKFSSGQIDRNKTIDELVRLNVSNHAGAGIRVGNAKLIFEAKLEKDALDIILKSKRLSKPIRKEALRILDGY